MSKSNIVPIKDDVAGQVTAVPEVNAKGYPVFQEDDAVQMFLTQSSTKNPTYFYPSTRPAIEAAVSLLNPSYDSFSNKYTIEPVINGVRTVQVVTDDTYTYIASWLEASDFKKINGMQVKEAIACLASVSSYDTAVDWINSLQWDGTPRINTFFTRYMGVPESNLAKHAGQYMWSALAGRCSTPTGLKADMMIVLIGDQGVGKTRGIEAISPNRDWHTEISLKTSEDDIARLTQGRLVVELAELKGLNSRDSEEIKAWITRTHDSWIPKFREDATDKARRFVLLGTTNEQQGFLSDPTGNRRFIPLEVRKQVDVEGIERDCLQLWAEALQLFRLKGVTWESVSLEVNKIIDDYLVHSEWYGGIYSFLFDQSGNIREVLLNEPPTTMDILRALSIDYKNATVSAKREVSKVMKQLGFESKQINHGKGGKSYHWVLKAS